MNTKHLAIGIIGAGRAAKALIPRWLAAGHDVVWQHRRSDGVALASHPEVDVVVVAVSDRALASMAAELAARPHAEREVWLHLSGSIPGSVLRFDTTHPRAAGCMHPLVALAGRDDTSPLNAVAGIDGDPDAIALAMILAEAAGLLPRAIAPDRKTLYHAAAVSVAGHATALFSQAMDLMIASGLTRDDARLALQPLFRSAADNLTSLPPENAITGPATRGDADTIARHLAAIDAIANPEAPAIAAVYRLLGARALTLSAPTLPADAVAAIQTALLTPAKTSDRPS